MIVFLIFGTACGGDKKNTAEDSGQKVETQISDDQSLAEVEKETAAELIRQFSAAEEIGPGAEWSVIAVARSSLAGTPEAQTIFMKYQDSLRLKTKQTEGILDPERPTDNAKAAIAMKMTGGDPSSVEGYDLLKPLEDVEKLKTQGVNAEIWALIAAGVCGKKLESDSTYIEDIIAMQDDEHGGITYDGENMDVDMTAMGIQALSWSMDENDKAADAVSAARSWLSLGQEDNGSYGNTESTAQVILALDSLGEDPDESKDFIKSKGNTLLDGMMLFHLKNGFRHHDEKTADKMATEQALCALDALLLDESGRSFYGEDDSE